MPRYLDQILASVRERTEAMKSVLGPNDAARLAAERPDRPRGFAAALSAIRTRFSLTPDQITAVLAESVTT